MTGSDGRRHLSSLDSGSPQPPAQKRSPQPPFTERSPAPIRLRSRGRSFPSPTPPRASDGRSARRLEDATTWNTSRSAARTPSRPVPSAFNQPGGRGIVLSLADRERVDFQLISSIVTLPEIAVSAATDARINPGRTGPAQTFTDTLLSRLPVVRRNFYHLIQLSPQAAPSPAGGASIAGQNDRLNGLQIDGGDEQRSHRETRAVGESNPGGAGVRTLSVEAMRELQVATAPFDVRFGTFAARSGERGDPFGIESLGGLALRILRGPGADRKGPGRRPRGRFQHEGARPHARRPPRA